MLHEQAVLDCLRTVNDPLTGSDIISRDMVRRIEINNNQVQFELLLSPAHKQNKTDLIFACIAAIQKHYANVDVHVHTVINSADPTSKIDTPLPQVKHIIAVGSGKGGVGKSTIAVNLALAIQSLGARVGILDADLYGPSIPTMLGIFGQRPQLKDVYNQPRLLPIEAYGLPAISIGNIIEPEQAVVLRGPRLAGIIKQFIHDTLWPELDFLIVDLPPGTGDIQLTLVQTVPVTGAVIVTTPQEVAVIDAVKAANMFTLPQIDVPILGIVENMSWFTPAELPGNKYFIFGEGGGKRLAQLCNTVLLGQIPLIQGIREGGDNGLPIVLTDAPAKPYFLAAAQKLLQQVVIRNETKPPTNTVKINPD